MNIVKLPETKKEVIYLVEIIFLIIGEFQIKQQIL